MDSHIKDYINPKMLMAAYLTCVYLDHNKSSKLSYVSNFIGQWNFDISWKLIRSYLLKTYNSISKCINLQKLVLELTQKEEKLIFIIYRIKRDFKNAVPGMDYFWGKQGPAQNSNYIKNWLVYLAL